MCGERWGAGRLWLRGHPGEESPILHGTALSWPGAAERQPPRGKRLLSVLQPLPLSPWAQPGQALPWPRPRVVRTGGRKEEGVCGLFPEPPSGWNREAGSPLGGHRIGWAACSLHNPRGHRSHPANPYAVAAPRGQSLTYWLVPMGKMLATKDLDGRDVPETGQGESWVS